jgi:hypothetical protein
MPNMQGKFAQNMDIRLDDRHIQSVYDEKKSFSYEFYGSDNTHQVNYEHLDIDNKLELITTLQKGMSIPYLETCKIAKKYKIPQVSLDFDIKEGDEIEAIPTDEFLNIYEAYLPLDQALTVDSFSDLYMQLREYFCEINENYRKSMGFTGKKAIIVEGSVWHWGETENYMIKNKDKLVEEVHKRGSLIPNEQLEKAIYKARDEIGWDNRNKVLDYVKRELKSDFDPIEVDDHRMKDRIFSRLGSIKADIKKRKRQVKLDVTLKMFAEQVEEVTGVEADTSDKLKEFVKQNPDKKHLAGCQSAIYL